MAIYGKGRDRNEMFQFLSVGSMVEVSSDEEGFNGAFYVAKILHSISKRRFLVEYQTLVSENDSNQLLVETAEVSFIRPLPPPPAADQTYELFEVVDAFHHDGWWKGVVSKVENLEDNTESTRYTVVFENPPEKLEFLPGELRLHLDWTYGKWVRPPNQKKMKGLAIGKGMAVEVSLDEENLGDAWFPAIVVEEVYFNSFLVEYCRSRNDGEDVCLKETVDSLHIRPIPPKLVVQKFDTLEAVYAFHDSCWRNGTVIATLKDGRYNVLLKFEKRAIKFRKSEIRPCLLWLNGRWISFSRVIPNNLQDEEQLADVDNSANDSRAVVSLEGSSTKLYNAERSSLKSKKYLLMLKQSTREKLKKPALEREEIHVSNSIKFTKEKSTKSLSAKEFRATFLSLKSTKQVKNSTQLFIQPQGPNQPETRLENGLSSKRERELNAQVAGQQVSAEVGEVNTKDLAEFTNGINHVNNDPGSCNPSIAETFFHRLHEETKVKIECNSSGQQDEGEQHIISAIKMEVEDYPSKEAELSTVKSLEHAGNREGKLKNFNQLSAAVVKDREMPFRKSSFLWDYIDSQQVFQFLPQNPHFRPLLECNEARREELAISHMLNFVNLVKRASNLEIENPTSVFDSCLKGLADLEMHGFDVNPIVDCINKSLSFKRRLEKFNNRCAEVHNKIAGCNIEKAKFEEDINAIDKMICELEEQRALKESLRVKKDLEGNFLQCCASIIRDNMFDVKQKFEDKAASLGRYMQ